MIPAVRFLDVAPALFVALLACGAWPAFCGPSTGQSSTALREPLRRPPGWEQIRALLNSREFTAAAGRAEVLLDSLSRTHGEDSIEYAEVLDLLVEAMRRGGGAAEPETQAQARRALAIKESILGPEDVHLAESLKNLADIDQSSGLFTDAEALLKRALRLAEAYYGEDDPSIERFLRDYGNTLLALGHYERAKSAYERSLQLQLTVLPEDHPRIADILYNLAIVNQDIGNFEVAKSLYEQVLELKERALGRDHVELPFYMNGLAALLNETGDYAGARKLYQVALDILTRSLGQDDLGVADLQNNLGVILKYMGDFTEAEIHLKHGLEIRERHLPPEHILIAQSLHNLGVVYRRTGQYEKARWHLERALAIKEEVLPENHIQTSTTLQEIASLDLDLGQLDEAEALYRKVLSILRIALDKPHPDLAWSMSRLGEIVAARGNLDEAEELLTSSLNIYIATVGHDHPQVARSQLDLAYLYSEKGDRALALDLALEAEQISRRHARLTFTTLPERQALAHAAIRTSGLDLALTVLSSESSGSERQRVWNAVVASRALVLDEIALRHRLLNLQAREESRDLAEKYSSANEKYANLFFRPPKSADPLKYRMSLEAARHEEEMAEQQLAEMCASLGLTLNTPPHNISEIKTALEPHQALVSFTRFSAALKRHEVRPAYGAFVLKEGESIPEYMFLGEGREIDELIKEWRLAIKRGSREAVPAGGGRSESTRTVAGQLAGRIWWPIMKRLGDTELAIIVPDGALNTVNFSALPDEEGAFVIDAGPLIHYASAEKDIVGFTVRAAVGTGLLALGNPSFDVLAGGKDAGTGSLRSNQGPRSSDQPFNGESLRSACGIFDAQRFPALPESQAEAEGIVALWSGADGSPVPETSDHHPGPPVDSRTVLLTGPAATESNFKKYAPGRRTIHLATHGFFLGDKCPSLLDVETRGIGGLSGQSNPPATRPSIESPLLLSGLVLAGANSRRQDDLSTDDGYLTAAEISAMNLSGVEWVALSACDTGLGTIKNGEGVLGLRRAFHVAGAATVIMSLWPVEETATREMMLELTRIRLNEHCSTAQAMRKATRAIIEARRRRGDSTHPFYWGAWIAEGDYH